MRLTALFLLFFTFQVSATGFGQEKINLRLKKTEISNVLRSIEQQTRYRFLYNNNLEDIREKVNINVKDAAITDVMPIILQKTRLQYQVMDNNLIVIKEDPNAPPADIVVKGLILGDGGAPLAGASVQVKGTTTGTTTANDGSFTLTVPDANATLVISSIGYEDMEVNLAGKTEVSVTMVKSTKVMEQVIVVGYGSQRKLDVTGSVGQVKGDDIAKQASVNPVSALQGKVAGVQITNSGAPGASPQIRIRGLGTIYGNPDPLYVVDGVWYNDISFLNPADIENISILKDASSEAIYGVRAANGVVLVTTKKGKSGQASINYNGYVGYQKVTNEVKMANGTEYAQLVNELSAINNAPPLFADPASFGKGTDWYHQILRNAMVTNHQVSVSGGSEKNTYNFSLGYLNQDGLVEKNNYQRYTVRLQNDFQVVKPLKVGYTVTGVASKSRDIPGSIFHELFAAAPVVPVYYADGTYGDPSDYNVGDGNNFNPQVTLDVFNQKSKNYRFTGSAYAELRFAPHFALRSSIGGELGQAEVRGYTPVYTATLKQRNTISSLSINRSETRNWIIENTLTYDNKFGDHSIRVLAGQSAQRNKYYFINGSAQNVPYSSEGDLYLALGNTTGRNITDGGSLNTATSYFGRVNYSFMNRYLLNASIRADAYSQFFGSHLWGYFPSVGAGWVISDESFMKDQHIFNNLKLRASWGKIGNAVVPINPSILTVTQEPYLTAIFNGQAYTGASVNTVVPPTINWEKGVGTDIGIEASLLKSRLYVEADWYQKKTEDAIFGIPILSSVGTGSGTIIGNQATFRNQGFEVAATWKDMIGEKVSYSIGGNISINDNKVLKVTTGANPIYAGGTAATGGALGTRTVLGQPIGQFYGLVVAGVFQTTAEVAGSAQPTAKPGDFRYIDQNKDGVIDGRDRMPLGNPNPKYTYGINTNWTYEQFDLTVDFQGVAGVDIYNANPAIRFGNENFTKDFYDNRWHGQGTSNTYPSVNIGGGTNYLPNSFFVESGSYFRIRNMQLGYTLSHSLTDRWKMKALRVFVDAQNAFNFFKYKGFSPEVGGTPTNAGIDVNVYPLSATYRFGVNVTL